MQHPRSHRKPKMCLYLHCVVVCLSTWPYITRSKAWKTAIRDCFDLFNHFIVKRDEKEKILISWLLCWSSFLAPGNMLKYCLRITSFAFQTLHIPIKSLSSAPHPSFSILFLNEPYIFLTWVYNTRLQKKIKHTQHSWKSRKKVWQLQGTEFMNYLFWYNIFMKSGGITLKLTEFAELIRDIKYHSKNIMFLQHE